ncbi:unannotated protein [freshwater metagenome]|jgi:hypothetical protein|uniref:Unannotated protein n=1 Tax=freshwater metagenome TaxID=449393 RepID=A0A6J7I9J1_9ZZZZ|nr:hypothetical protein [Actinomycetota bacterium]
MRAYLPLSHDDLAGFLESGSFHAAEVFAPTPNFVAENLDCDQEEIEYLLSVMGGEAALNLRTSQTAPGIVLAVDLVQGQYGEARDATYLVIAPIHWDQVQCALLAEQGEDELIWFATQEITQELDNWK